MAKMSWWCFILALALVGNPCLDVLQVAGDLDIGTAILYDPPSLRKIGIPYQFPKNGLYVFVSNGIWAGGAARGQKISIHCISGPNSPCKDGTILVEVVDVCLTNPCPATFLLSRIAIDAISKSLNATLNVEYLLN